MTADRPLLAPLSLHRCTGESSGQRQVVVYDVGIHGCNPATAASLTNPVASLADRPPTDVACDQVGTQPRSAPRQDLGYRPRDRTVVLTVPSGGQRRSRGGLATHPLHCAPGSASRR